MKLYPAARKSKLVEGDTDPTTARFQAAIPRTKAGHIKGRLSPAEKLHALDPFSDPKATEDRLDQFQELFGFWRLRPALTYTSEEHLGCWFTRKKGMLYLEDVARHLLANRLYPALNPQWVAPRSGRTTTFFCIDLDLKEYDDDPAAVRELKRRNFEHHREYVEDRFRLMGINPRSRRQVLIQNTPSGGLHYYVFLDNAYHVDTVGDALAGAGLHHTPGEIEVYPKQHLCLRLPFGHVPGQRHDPAAWIQFIDDYANGKIRRFSLEELIETHFERTAELRRKQQHRTKVAPVPVPTPAPKSKPYVASIGLPKRFRSSAPVPNANPVSDSRFATLMRDGIRSLQDANDLWQLGIREHGTRHWVLKQLAMHLVWFRKRTAAEAATELTDWAMDHRHQSRTIQRDLTTGRDETPRQIRSLCNWCELRDRGTASPGQGTVRTYSREELTHLCAVLNSHPGPDRHAQAQFYLRFLWFAKRYGTPAEDRSGWEAAPAVRPIIRSWPGCSHMKYKARLTAAEGAGVFRRVREKKQTPNGTGRARTYRLTVPVSHPDDWTVGEDEALKWLETGIPVEPTSEPEPAKVVVETNHPVKEDEHVSVPGRTDVLTGECAGTSGDCDPRGADPSPVPAEGSREHLDTSSRERPAERAAASDLFGFADVRVEPAPEPAEEACEELEMTVPADRSAQSAGVQPPVDGDGHQEPHSKSEGEQASVVEVMTLPVIPQGPRAFQAEARASTPAPRKTEHGQPETDSGQHRADEFARLSSDLWHRPGTPWAIRRLLTADRMSLSIEQLQLVGWAVENERRQQRGEQPKQWPPHLRKHIRGRW